MFCGIVSEVIAAQPLKALEPICVKLSGRVKFSSELQLWNAELPIDVTELPKVRFARFIQLMKAFSPIEVRFVGRVKLLSKEQPANALAPICVRLSGRLALCNAAQPLNALALIAVTPCGISISVREEQFWNALAPIEVTLGIVTVVIFAQPLNVFASNATAPVTFTFLREAGTLVEFALNALAPKIYPIKRFAVFVLPTNGRVISSSEVQFWNAD